MGDDSGCETPVKDTAEVATRETAAREHVTEELTTKRKAEVAAPETTAPFQKQRHHDPSRLSPDGRRRRRHNEQSLANYHNMKRGEAGCSKVAPKSQSACLTPAAVPYWVRDSTFLHIQRRILTRWLTSSRRNAQ